MPLRSGNDWLQAIAAIASLLAPLVAFVAWLLRREFARSDAFRQHADRLFAMMGTQADMMATHFRHDEEAQRQTLAFMQRATDALSLLVDRTAVLREREPR
jgi:hypothetical protein